MFQSIHIEVIPHSKQRYEVLGDWWWEGNQLQVRVSDMGDPRYNVLVALHETHEAILATYRGTANKSVDLSGTDPLTAFDKEFEAARTTAKDGSFLFRGRQVDEHAEPGDEIDCPLYYEHVFASNLERLLARELNVDWNTYYDDTMVRCNFPRFCVEAGRSEAMSG